jgi:hypothetical protein
MKARGRGFAALQPDLLPRGWSGSSRQGNQDLAILLRSPVHPVFPGRLESASVAARRSVPEGQTPVLREKLTQFVSGTRGKVRLEALPGYAPDLNPWDEGGWNHLKHVEMRNLVCRDLEELHEQFHLAIGRVRHKPQLVRSFFAQAGLAIEKV